MKEKDMDITYMYVKKGVIGLFTLIIYLFNISHSPIGLDSANLIIDYNTVTHI